MTLSMLIFEYFAINSWIDYTFQLKTLTQSDWSVCGLCCFQLAVLSSAFLLRLGIRSSYKQICKISADYDKLHIEMAANEK